jgi:transposase
MRNIKCGCLNVKVDNIDIDAVIAQAKEMLSKEKISPGFKTIIELMMALFSALINRLNKNSRNSNKPPASDPNRKRGSKRPKSGKKPGGQNGHKGNNLSPVENPDKIESLKIDKRRLPPGEYQDVGYESRQVIDIKISRFVTEYQAQILENEMGKRFVAEFPEQVTRSVQYGSQLKATAVYMSQFQLIPYNRIQDYFNDQVGLPISSGSLFNFNQEAFEKLEPFEGVVKEQIISASVANFDETGINVDKKRIWLHSSCNELWSYFYPHAKRGKEAMDDINILPNFEGVACHDHWWPYFQYSCLHSLCNAHHIRELEAVIEQDKHQWAQSMLDLLVEINQTKQDANGKLSTNAIKKYKRKYRSILKKGDQECPAAVSKRKPGQRGKIKQTKARNLFVRLRDHEEDTLRFMVDPNVPFTNNQGENDLRMTKVQQKISGCFRSIEGAYIFCRIRGFLLSCRKHQVMATDALNDLFAGKFPAFISELMQDDG